ncbi:MAG: hypothetical protein ACI9YT_000432 [Halobacteriales archaeon]|jgi:hypothetical protein
MSILTGFEALTRDGSAITRAAVLGVVAGVVFGVLIQFRPSLI